MRSGSKTLKSWLQTGSKQKKRVGKEENISASPVETKVNYSQLTTSGYFSSSIKVPTVEDCIWIPWDPNGIIVVAIIPSSWMRLLMLQIWPTGCFTSDMK